MDCPDYILSILGEDLLSRIYAFIDDESDRKSFRTTCKVFYRVDSQYRTHLRVRRLEFLPQLLSNFTCITSLDLSVCPRVDDGSVAVVLHYGSAPGFQPGWTGRLRRLILRRSCGLKFYGLEMLVRACRFLEVVDVSYSCSFGDMEASALSCAAEVTDLRLDKCLGVTDVGLAKIAVGCPKLERLSLKWCFEITDLGIDLLSKKCVNLKHLDISYLKVTSESLRSIARMEKLEVLEMVGCCLVDDVGMHYLGNGCPLLQVSVPIKLF